MVRYPLSHVDRTPRPVAAGLAGLCAALGVLVLVPGRFAGVRLFGGRRGRLADGSQVHEGRTGRGDDDQEDRRREHKALDAALSSPLGQGEQRPDLSAARKDEGAEGDEGAKMTPTAAAANCRSDGSDGGFRILNPAL